MSGETDGLLESQSIPILEFFDSILMGVWGANECYYMKMNFLLRSRLLMCKTVRIVAADY